MVRCFMHIVTLVLFLVVDTCQSCPNLQLKPIGGADIDHPLRLPALSYGEASIIRVIALNDSSVPFRLNATVELVSLNDDMSASVLAILAESINCADPPPYIRMDRNVYDNVATKVSDGALIHLQVRSGNATTARVPMIVSSPEILENAKWVGGFNALRGYTKWQTTQSAVKYATLQFTAVGCASIFVNGHRVSNPMMPGWAHVPEVRWPVEAFDVTSIASRAQANSTGLVIAAYLGKCMWGYRDWDCIEGDNPKACQALRGVLTIGYQDGSKQVLETAAGDPAWLGTASPIVFNDLFDGEVWDQQRDHDLTGWMVPGALPAPPTGGGFLQLVSITPYVSENLVFQTNPPLAAVAYHQVSSGPQRAGSEGQLVWRFAANRAGICNFTVSPSLAKAAGLQPKSWLAIQYGELINDDGTVHNQFGSGCPVDKVNCASQTDNVTLGDAVVSMGLFWETHFTYHGFMYAGLMNWPAGAPLPPSDALQCIALSSSMEARMDIKFGSTVDFTNPDSAAISASDRTPADTLQTIVDAVALTQLNAMHFHPEDCPTREKRGWMGDSQWGAEPLMFAFQADDIYRTFIQSIRDHQTYGCAEPNATHTQLMSSVHSVQGYGDPLPGPPHELCCGFQSRFGCQPNRTPVNASGSVPDVVPFPWGPIGGFPGDPNWMAAACTMPFARYTAYGSVQQLQVEYVVCSDYLDFMERNLKGGLAQWGFYGDWLAPDKDKNTTQISTIALIISAQQGAAMAKSLGLAADRTRWTTLATNAGLAVRNAFRSDSTGRYDDGTAIQASNLMAIYAGVESNSSGGAATALINDIVSTRSMHLSTGSSSSRYILQALELCGERSQVISSDGMVSFLPGIAGSDVAAKLAVQTTQPSWGFFVQNASWPQTMWENWQVHPPSVGASSLDHPFLGAGVQRWAQTHAVGLVAGYDNGAFEEARNIVGCAIRSIGSMEAFTVADAASSCIAEESSGSTPSGSLSVRLAPGAGAIHALGAATGSLSTHMGVIRSSWGFNHAAYALSFQLAGPAGLQATVGASLRALMFDSNGDTRLTGAARVEVSIDGVALCHFELMATPDTSHGVQMNVTDLELRCPGLRFSEGQVLEHAFKFGGTSRSITYEVQTWEST